MSRWGILVSRAGENPGAISGGYFGGITLFSREKGGCTIGALPKMSTCKRMQNTGTSILLERMVGAPDKLVLIAHNPVNIRKSVTKKYLANEVLCKQRSTQHPFLLAPAVSPHTD